MADGLALIGLAFSGAYGSKTRFREIHQEETGDEYRETAA
jgi:hypothetical protein